MENIGLRETSMVGAKDPGTGTRIRYGTGLVWYGTGTVLSMCRYGGACSFFLGFRTFFRI